jgi:hypothetical protein
MVDHRSGLAVHPLQFKSFKFLNDARPNVLVEFAFVADGIYIARTGHLHSGRHGDVYLLSMARSPIFDLAAFLSARRCARS